MKTRNASAALKEAVRLLSVAAILLGTGGAASASSIQGKVTFIGTVSEDSSGGAYQAQARVRVLGTCDNDYTPKDRWLLIRSGRTEGVFAHNAVNMKNAYSTLVSALLSGKNVQIDALPNCSTIAIIPVNLWAAQVGMY